MPSSLSTPPLPFPPGTPLLVGVSGGRDSMALLHWLHSRDAGPLTICHLDHGLRASSRADAALVRRTAKALGIPCIVARKDTAALARQRHLSIETAAREARYAFFHRCAKKTGCPRIVLAHHADDQAETFLLHLLRGAGADGLGAMPNFLDREGGLLVARPWLGIWRTEIDAYVTAHSIPFAEDPSNADRKHTRNRLRHDALPALSAAMGRDVRPALWRAAAILQAEAEHLRAITPEPAHRLRVDTLRAMPLALLRRHLLRWLRKQGVLDCGFEEVERLRSLLGPGPAKVNLPQDHHARRRAGEIWIEKIAPL